MSWSHVEEDDDYEPVLFMKAGDWPRWKEHKLISWHNNGISISEIGGRLGESRDAISARILHIGTCDRCGRNTHYTNTCYALTHVNGKHLSKIF